METFSAQMSKSYANLVNKLTDWLNIIILQLPNIVIALIVAALAHLFSKYVRRVAIKLTKRFTTNTTILNLTSNLTAVIFGAFTLFIILSILNLGESINKILATAGVLGLAVGLALQDPMTNLFSGIFLSVRDLYTIGDLVESNGYFGTIIDIDLKSTKLMLPTGQEVVIPNKEVIQNPLKNFTASGNRRIDVSCGISYGDDLNKVEKLVIDTIQKLPGILQGKPVDLVFNEFGDSSINFMVRFWIKSTSQREYLMKQSNAIKAIKKVFDSNDIMIPFPIRTLDFGIKGGVPLTKMLHVANRTNGTKQSNLIETK